MDERKNANERARSALVAWQKDCQDNCYDVDPDYQHTINMYFSKDKAFIKELSEFGAIVSEQLEPLVNLNHEADNLPKLMPYTVLGAPQNVIEFHPSYDEIGDLIYGSNLMAHASTAGELLKCLAILFLSSQVGEAGHNCPIACSAGILRVLRSLPLFPNKDFYIKKLTTPSYQENYTGAQFVTEIQGGSDVGTNVVFAKKESSGKWRITGEKWFCSNASADLMFVTARYDENIQGTKGLALFLVRADLENEKNHYTIRRLKDKIGTRTMATGEIEFHGAEAELVGELDSSFHLVMDNVLHLSRLFNAFCVLGMARRAYHIAYFYAKHRVAFQHEIIHYPLLKEQLSTIKSENIALTAAIFFTGFLQDQVDVDANATAQKKLLLRLLVNFQKYLTACWSVEHIHVALGILAGNGAIETFSSIPRLLRDCIVCENWEGTHNVLRMQILRDIHKYHVDDIFMSFMEKEISTIKAEQDVLQEVLKTLQQSCKQFHGLSADAQALQIKDLVDKMAILFVAYALLREAMDQRNKSKETSKWDCYHLFINKYILKDELATAL